MIDRTVGLPLPFAHAVAALIGALLWAFPVPAQVLNPGDLDSRSYSALRLHATHFIRTPDGVFWDMWGEQEYLALFNKSVNRVPIKRERSGRGWTESVTVRHEWRLEESRETLAWALPRPGTAFEANYWVREIGGTPPLWFSRPDEPMMFIYINEKERDIISATRNTRSTKVVADLGGNLFKLAVSHGRGLSRADRKSPSRVDGNMIVHVEKPAVVIRQGYLTGEYILWPDVTINLPAGASGPTYRYLAVSELRPTPDQLALAVLANQAELVDWDYKREGGTWRWVRRTVPLNFANPTPPSPPAAPEEKPAKAEPAVEPTHLLILSSGEYLYGRLISENDAEVRFEVVSGSLSAERAFARSAITKVAKLEK